MADVCAVMSSSVIIHFAHLISDAFGVATMEKNVKMRLTASVTQIKERLGVQYRVKLY